MFGKESGAPAPENNEKKFGPKEVLRGLTIMTALVLAGLTPENASADDIKAAMGAHPEAGAQAADTLKKAKESGALDEYDWYDDTEWSNYNDWETSYSYDDWSDWENYSSDWGDFDWGDLKPDVNVTFGDETKKESE